MSSFFIALPEREEGKGVYGAGDVIGDKLRITFQGANLDFPTSEVNESFNLLSSYFGRNNETFQLSLAYTLTDKSKRKELGALLRNVVLTQYLNYVSALARAEEIYGLNLQNEQQSFITSLKSSIPEVSEVILAFDKQVRKDMGAFSGTPMKKYLAAGIAVLQEGGFVSLMSQNGELGGVFSYPRNLSLEGYGNILGKHGFAIGKVFGDEETITKVAVGGGTTPNSSFGVLRFEKQGLAKGRTFAQATFGTLDTSYGKAKYFQLVGIKDLPRYGNSPTSLSFRGALGLQRDTFGTSLVTDIQFRRDKIYSSAAFWERFYSILGVRYWDSALYSPEFRVNAGVGYDFRTTSGKYVSTALKIFVSGYNEIRDYGFGLTVLTNDVVNGVNSLVKAATRMLRR